MKKDFVLLCTLLCFCLCFAACGVQPSPKSNGAPANSSVQENEIPNVELTVKKALHVSDTPYTRPSGSDPNSGGVNEDLLIYVEDAYGCAILFDILGEDVVVDYGENMYTDMDIWDGIQTPGLYNMIHHFNISQEDLLEAADTGRYGRQYDKNILRAMYLPYEDMLEVTMNPKGAYLDGKVHDIQTLNELFENDKEAFARIKLDDLIDYQERLEENGVEYGFNEDMVEFANQNCIVATSLAFLNTDYSVGIPGSVTVNAAVYDQYGNQMTGEAITYALQSVYTGVSVDSATGVVTVQSSAAAGTVSIQASCGTLAVAEAILTLAEETPIATTIDFIESSYSIQIPNSGSSTTTVTAHVKDQYGDVLPGCKITYSIEPAYNGVSINSTTGVVTIQSTAVAGTMNIHASYGLLSVSIPLTLTNASISYTLYIEGNEYLNVNEQFPAYINAYVRNNQGVVVTTPELVSIVYNTETGVTNDTGIFYQDELGLDPYNGHEIVEVTVTATLSNGTVLQGSHWIEGLIINPR